MARKGRSSPQPANPLSSAAEDPLRLGALMVKEAWQKYKTVDKIDKKPVCRAFNDGRGCDKWCPQSRGHRCDVLLTSGEACARPSPLLPRPKTAWDPSVVVVIGRRDRFEETHKSEPPAVTAFLSS